MDLFTKIGFPAAIAIFVLVRMNGKLERLTIAMTQLSERVEQLTARLDK